MINLVALCAIGVEKILGNEIKLLGYTLKGQEPGRVYFEGNEDALYVANLWLRTADRVLLQMADFECLNFDSLYEGIFNVNWQDYFNKNVKVVIEKVRIHSSKLNSQRTVQSMAQKAIYAKLGKEWSMETLPESGEKAEVRLYLTKDRMLVLLDLSGEPLNRRGYRTSRGEAPIRETLAAALLQKAVWRRKTPLHDPFCGSGTFVAEAALYACNVAPGIARNFAIESLKIFDSRKSSEIWKKAVSEIRTDCVYRITGSDIAPDAVMRAKMNVEHALVAAGRALQKIGSDAKLVRPEFVQADFMDLQAPFEKGLLITNPPYGERIGDKEQAIELYKKMAVFKESFANWQLGVITSFEDFTKYFGIREEKRTAIQEGNIPTWFYLFNF